MKKIITKKGFTIIEVLLFLAISSAIFAVLMSNTSSTVARRRYNDTVNDVVEEIRNAYSATINVENYRTQANDSSLWCSTVSAYIGGFHKDNESINGRYNYTDKYPGRTRCAVYGQVLTFGENNSTDIHRYTIVGKVLEKNIEPGERNSDDVLEALKEVGADIVSMKENNASLTSCSPVLAGNYSVYSPQWTGRIENRNDRGLYKGAIMIARSPMSASVHTYVYPNSGDNFNVQNWLTTTSSRSCANGFVNADQFSFVRKAINHNNWSKTQNIDICIGSDDLYGTGNKRRAVRIHGDGSTESAVELLSEADSNTICKEI